MTSAPSSEATPRPWRTYIGDSYKASKTHIIWAPSGKAKIGECVPITRALIVSDGGRPICELEAIGREREAIATAEANAAFILAAVNSYDESRKLLEDALKSLERACDWLYNGFEPDNQCKAYGACRQDAARIRAHLEAGK